MRARAAQANEFVNGALIITNALFTFARDNQSANHRGVSLGLGASAFRMARSRRIGAANLWINSTGKSNGKTATRRSPR
ncbi:hypothetical protein HYPGJ_30920 [Hyphomicrobium sp. GJ21]|nr:hypothetical protein HYPGJ_30920 [Hyphomicrobium sp. GJ21]